MLEEDDDRNSAEQTSVSFYEVDNDDDQKKNSTAPISVSTSESPDDEEERKRRSEAFLLGTVSVKDKDKVSFGSDLSFDKNDDGTVTFNAPHGTKIVEERNADGYVYKIEGGANAPIDQVHKITIPRKDENGNIIKGSEDVIYLNNENKLLDYDIANPDVGQGVSKSWLKGMVDEMEARRQGLQSGANISSSEIPGEQDHILNSGVSVSSSDVSEEQQSIVSGVSRNSEAPDFTVNSGRPSNESSRSSSISSSNTSPTVNSDASVNSKSKLKPSTIRTETDNKDNNSTHKQKLQETKRNFKKDQRQQDRDLLKIHRKNKTDDSKELVGNIESRNAATLQRAYRAFKGLRDKTKVTNGDVTPDSTPTTNGKGKSNSFER